MGEFTVETMRTLFKRAGAKRVSDKAAEELGKVVAERARAVALEAKRLAEHANRSTVLKRDVKHALKTAGTRP